MGSDNNLSPIVSVANVRKNYGDVEALRGISFEIKKGEVFGLLGPNGAGKTTTIEILVGLRPPDAGSVRVCGLDPTRESEELKQRIGAQLQGTVFPDKVTVEEALRLFASFYRRKVSVESLLEDFGLAEKRRAFFDVLSGGQRQRMALALALVNDPELVLLDEPTVGLDAMVRRDIYAIVERFRSEGRTVLLTTHYIEEAERLCDHVAIIDQGQVVAVGTPRQLVDHSGKGTRLEVRLARPVHAEELKKIESVLDCRESDGIYILHAQPVTQAIVGLIHYLESDSNSLLDLHIAQPSLEDVFVEMTGRKMEE